MTNAKPTEVVLASDTRNYAQMMNAGTLHWTGTLSWTAAGGGSAHDMFYPGDVAWDASDATIGPDGNISLDHSYDNLGNDSSTTNLGPADLPLAIGSLSGSSYLPTGAGGQLWSSFNESVHAKVVLHTGGRGKISNLFQLTATATEELAAPPYSQAIPPPQISVAGQTLNASGVAYAIFPDGATIDITPQAGAPYYDFTVGAQKYLCYFTAYAEEPNPGGGRDSIIRHQSLRLTHLALARLPATICLKSRHNKTFIP